MRLKDLMKQENSKGPLGFVETEASGCGRLGGMAGAEASLEQVGECVVGVGGCEEKQP